MNEQLVQSLLETNSGLVEQNKLLINEIGNYAEECT